MNDWNQGPWRVVSIWSEDRYATELQCHDGQVFLPCWSSHEGTSEDAWPPSPPLQQLVAEDGGGAPVLLGVGMAGTSHWSLSYSLSSDQQTLIMEAACRLTACPSLWLGSRFRLAPQWHLESQGEELIGMGNGLKGWRLSPLVGSRLSLTQDGELWVEPKNMISDQKKPQTVAWGMRIERC